MLQEKSFIAKLTLFCVTLKTAQTIVTKDIIVTKVWSQNIKFQHHEINFQNIIVLTMETSRGHQKDEDIATKLSEIDNVQSILVKKEEDLEDQINDIFTEIASVLEDRRKEVIAQLRSRIDEKCQRLGLDPR